MHNKQIQAGTHEHTRTLNLSGFISKDQHHQKHTHTAWIDRLHQQTPFSLCACTHRIQQQRQGLGGGWMRKRKNNNSAQAVQAVGWKQRKKERKMIKKRVQREKEESDKERERHKVTGREAEAEWSDSVPQSGLNTNSFICWHPLPPDTAVNCTYYHILCRHTSLSPEHTHTQKQFICQSMHTLFSKSQEEAGVVHFRATHSRQGSCTVHTCSPAHGGSFQ